MKKTLIVLLFTAATFHVAAQSIRVSRHDAPWAWYVDAGRFYNYNRYEGSRIELGFTGAYPNSNSTQGKHLAKPSLRLNGYVAYGFRDQGVKFGGSANWRPQKHSITYGIGGRHDLEYAASRNLSKYQMLLPANNSCYLTSRYVGVNSGWLSLSASPTPKLDLSAWLQMSWEDYRFDGRNIFYPSIYPNQKNVVRQFSELILRAEWNKCVTMRLRGGMAEGLYDGNILTDRTEQGYFSGLLQYDAQPGKKGLYVFAQVGFASHQAPYSRMFDLSGTAYAPYFFRNNFLTVRPNAFAAHYFAHLCLYYRPPLPLWELSWSQPRAFLQVNAMIGGLHGQDEKGCAMVDNIPLQAPFKGLIEPASGFDGLLRWGLMDIGVGVAYQICPHSAPYSYQDPSDNIIITMVANLILDKIY